MHSNLRLEILFKNQSKITLELHEPYELPLEGSDTSLASDLMLIIVRFLRKHSLISLSQQSEITLGLPSYTVSVQNPAGSSWTRTMRLPSNWMTEKMKSSLDSSYYKMPLTE